MHCNWVNSPVSRHIHMKHKHKFAFPIWKSTAVENRLYKHCKMSRQPKIAMFSYLNFLNDCVDLRSMNNRYLPTFLHYMTLIPTISRKDCLFGVKGVPCCEVFISKIVRFFSKCIIINVLYYYLFDFSYLELRSYHCCDKFVYLLFIMQFFINDYVFLFVWLLITIPGYSLIYYNVFMCY